MNADQFKAINADLPTERNGFAIQFDPMLDGKGFFLFLEIPLEATNRDLMRIIPLVRQWQKRIQAQYDRTPADAIETWAPRIDRKEITYAQLSRRLLSELSKACYEMHETGIRGTALRILFQWGYSTKKAWELLDLATERIKKDEPPFEAPPIDPDRVRNQINRWKRRQNKRA